MRQLASITGYCPATISKALKEIQQHAQPVFQLTAAPKGEKLVTNGRQHSSYRFTLIHDSEKFAEARDRHSAELERHATVIAQLITRMLEARQEGIGEGDNLKRDAEVFFKTAISAGFDTDLICTVLGLNAFKRIWLVKDKVIYEWPKSTVSTGDQWWESAQPMVAAKMSAASEASAQDALAFLQKATQGGVMPEKIMGALNLTSFRSCEMTAPDGTRFAWLPFEGQRDTEVPKGVTQTKNSDEATPSETRQNDELDPIEAARLRLEHSRPLLNSCLARREQ